ISARRTRNGGPWMLFGRGRLPQRWAIVAAPATSLSHRCGCPAWLSSIGGPSMRLRAEAGPGRAGPGRSRAGPGHAGRAEAGPDGAEAGSDGAEAGPGQNRPERAGLAVSGVAVAELELFA